LQTESSINEINHLETIVISITQELFYCSPPEKCFIKYIIGLTSLLLSITFVIAVKRIRNMA
jgi:hypothetical protein